MFVDQLRRCPLVDPLGPMQRRRGMPGDDATPTRPQPSGAGARRRGELCARRDVDVGMEGDESASQPVPGQLTRRERFAAEERFSHAGSVACRTDSDAERVLRAENRPNNRREFTLGEEIG
jgi:hypothetical protein